MDTMMYHNAGMHARCRGTCTGVDHMRTCRASSGCMSLALLLRAKESECSWAYLNMWKLYLGTVLKLHFVKYMTSLCQIHDLSLSNTIHFIVRGGHTGHKANVNVILCFYCADLDYSASGALACAVVVLSWALTFTLGTALFG